MKITIVGSGYVGLSLATLISQHHDVKLLDIDKKKINLINQRISPFNDSDIAHYFKSKKLNLVATLNKKEAYVGADFIIIATATNYDNELNSFNTDSKPLKFILPTAPDCRLSHAISLPNKWIWFTS